MGMPSRVLERTKLDFYRDTVREGLRVLGSGELGKVGEVKKFPVIVKPAKFCAGVWRGGGCICWNREVVVDRVRVLDGKLELGGKVAREDWFMGVASLGAQPLVEGLALPMETAWGVRRRDCKMTL